MNRKRQIASGFFAAAAMLVLILDSKTALRGAGEAIDLCVRTLIPSLFPFLFISGILSSAMIGKAIPALRPVAQLCGLPAGAEFILTAGFLGGYPLGAQSVCNAYEAGSLHGSDARRMLAFCNNCGPAFIFGVCGSILEHKAAPWVLLGIHMLSAFGVAISLHSSNGRSVPISEGKPSTAFVLQGAIRSMGNICGWVVLFRILICYLDRWVLWFFPKGFSVALCGFLELSNGCIELSQIGNGQLRFVLCAGFVSFGGLCVAMQTIQAAGKVDTGLYFPGKVVQCIISVTLALALCGSIWALIGAVISTTGMILLRKYEKRCRNPQLLVV